MNPNHRLAKVPPLEFLRQAAKSPAFVAMSHATAGECGGLLSGFLSLLRTSETSRQHTDTQREELQALCDTTEFFYRHDLEPGSRRTKSRRWGVVYFYEPNEPRDEGDPSGPGTGGVTPPQGGLPS